jgi:hypothetical protein
MINQVISRNGYRYVSAQFKNYAITPLQVQIATYLDCQFIFKVFFGKISWEHVSISFYYLGKPNCTFLMSHFLYKLDNWVSIQMI